MSFLDIILKNRTANGKREPFKKPLADKKEILGLASKIAKARRGK